MPWFLFKHCIFMLRGSYQNIGFFKGGSPTAGETAFFIPASVRICEVMFAGGNSPEIS